MMPRMKTRLAAIALTLVASSLFWMSDAQACSCLLPSASAARDASVFVFEGVLTRVTPPTDGSSVARGVFRIARVWKGAPARELTVEIPAQPSMCPPHFEVGERYIVYTSGTPAAPRVSSCARYAGPTRLRSERRDLGPPIHTFPR